MEDDIKRLWNLFTAAHPYYIKLLEQQYPQQRTFIYLVLEVSTGGGAFIFVVENAQGGITERHMQFETIREAGDLVLQDLIYIATSKYLA